MEPIASLRDTEPRDADLPDIAVRLARPDLSPWTASLPLPGVVSLNSGAPGPHVVLVSLVHGNEIAGAILLDRWLRAGLRPRHGRLTCVFANLAAFARFDPAEPTASRFIDEDMNRLWCPDVLDGPRASAELDRARALRPVFDSADVLLDLHSMLWQEGPLILCGMPEKARGLACGIGVPPLVVADEGHGNGRRLIDYPPFADPADPRIALLVEAGLHWEGDTVATMEACATRLLAALGLLAQGGPVGPPGRLAQVTRTVVANSHHFSFVRAVRGGEVVPERNTLIALDGDIEVRTPHDDCLLVMPALRPFRGHTAVRLARFV